MQGKRPATKLAEPPWTYAPSEVMAWVSSGTQRSRPTTTSSPPPVKEISVRCPSPEALRALRRFDALVAHGAARGRSGIAESRPWAFGRRKIVREGEPGGVRG